MTRPPTFVAFAAAALCCLAARAADPGYYVVTVYDDPGIRTVDVRYWSVHDHDGTSQWPEVGIGYNMGGRWTTELLASFIDEYDGGLKRSAFEWQNDFLLTRGQLPFDLALHTLYSTFQHGGGSFEAGPAVQTNVGRLQVNANVFVDRDFGHPYEDSADDNTSDTDGRTELRYQWQLRYHWRPSLHVGAQGFGELGPWNHWAGAAGQSHRAGPALFGNVPTGSGAWSWQAAVLFGRTYQVSARMLTARVKYEF